MGDSQTPSSSRQPQDAAAKSSFDSSKPSSSHGAVTAEKTSAPAPHATSVTAPSSATTNATTTASTIAAQSAPSSSTQQQQPRDVADVLEERLINAEYKIWKKNTPYLYDFVMTHSLEWPSLTCQWLPTVKGDDSSSGDRTTEYVEHSLLHTTGEQNYLMIGSVNLPKNDAVIDHRQDGAGNASSAAASTNDTAANSATATTTTSAVAVAANYDDDKGELGGFGSNSGTTTPAAKAGRIEIRMKIKHEGEVNRARHMPQNHFIVASRGPNPELYIWDVSRHPSFPEDNSVFAPQGVLVGGHTREGYGLAWSPHTEGRLISGSEDGSVCLWDVTASIAKGSKSGTQINPLSTFRCHTDVVEDVDWHPKDANLIGSVGDDCRICIWDVREKNPTKAVHTVEKAHDGYVNGLAFNPVNEFMLATGSADKTVALWDMRNLKTKMQTLSGHTDQVLNVEWAPFNESILASCSQDRRVNIWDLSRIGMEQSPQDAEDGPPELLFIHGGHTGKVCDFSWNGNDEWTVASVSEDNVLQVWNMAEEIYAEDVEELMETEDEEENDTLEDDELE